MPKYRPTPDDMYNTTPCFICGCDVLEEGATTCCSDCESMKTSMDEDWEQTLFDQADMEEGWDF